MVMAAAAVHAPTVPSHAAGVDLRSSLSTAADSGSVATPHAIAQSMEYLLVIAAVAVAHVLSHAASADLQINWLKPIGSGVWCLMGQECFETPETFGLG